jgi:hypothetical protein
VTTALEYRETPQRLRIAEVALDKLAQTAVVVDSGRARAAGDEELEARDAERVLDVDGEEAQVKGVLCRWA